MNLNDLTSEELEPLMRLQYYCWSQGSELYPTGSREIGGYTRDSDYDFAFNCRYVGSSALISLGFFSTGEEYIRSTISTFRNNEGRGRINLLGAHTDGDFRNWKKATTVAKLLGPVDKASRIRIFDAVLNGETGVTVT